MRKIEREMVNALINCKSANLGNTVVEFLPEERLSKIYLFKNHIADYFHHKDEFEVNQVTLMKWKTRTTISRLRALNINVYTKDHVTYLDGKPI